VFVTTPEANKAHPSVSKHRYYCSQWTWKSSEPRVNQNLIPEMCWTVARCSLPSEFHLLTELPSSVNWRWTCGDLSRERYLSEWSLHDRGL